MKLHTANILVLAFAASLLAASPMPAASTAPAAPASTPPPKGFDAFRLVKTRNIFDPDRKATVTSAPASGRPSALTTRANFINLTGTMVAQGKMLAFFSGSRSEYSKVISVGDSIADFKVTGITTAKVDLEHAGKQITVAVGTKVPLEGSSAAVTVEPATGAKMPANSTTPPSDTAVAAPDAPAADTATASETDTKPSAPIDEKSEILKRMMERREKELSK